MLPTTSEDYCLSYGSLSLMTPGSLHPLNLARVYAVLIFFTYYGSCISSMQVSFPVTGAGFELLSYRPRRWLWGGHRSEGNVRFVMVVWNAS